MYAIPAGTVPAPDYTWGYFFTPQLNGRITHLAGYFTGIATVRVRDNAGVVLGAANINSPGAWTVADIGSIPVTANFQYRVEVYIPPTDVLFTYLSTDAVGSAFPQLIGNVLVQGYGLTPGDAPITTVMDGAAYMGGLVDIGYMPDTAPAEFKVSQSSLSFSATLGKGSPASQNITLTNQGGTNSYLNWSTSILSGNTWLSTNPVSGSLAGNTSTPVAVSVDTSGFNTVGSQTPGQFQFMDAVAGTQLINVPLTITDDQRPWLSGGIGNTYASPADNTYGYAFTPLKSGKVVRLGGFFSGTKTVTLYNKATQAVLASVDVSSTNNWSYVDLAVPVNVTAGTQYVVAVYLNNPLFQADLAGTYRYAGGATLVPMTYGDIQIVEAVWTVGNGYPATSFGTPGIFVFGQADIGFIPDPAIGVAPASFTFNATQGGTAPAFQTLSISNIGSGTLNWTAVAATSTGGAWLSIAPGSGSNNGTITVTATLGTLVAGTYNGTITVSAAGASNTPQLIPVSFVVAEPAPSIGLSPTTLTFNATEGGSSPVSQTINISNTGGGTLNWTAVAATSTGGSWLSVNPGSGTNAGTLTVTATLGSLAAGTYNGTITVSATGANNTPQTIPVSFVVSVPPPSIGLSSTSLSYSATQGGPNPGTQTVNITNTGGGTLNWTAVAATSSGGAWLSVSPGSGTNAGTLTVTATLGALTAGTYNGTITVSATGATNTPQVINVTFTVTAPGLNVTPASLTFTAIQSGTSPASQNLTITNTGTASLNWSAVAATTSGGSWLTLTAPTSGTIAAGGSSNLTVNATLGTLVAGTYNGTVTISDTSGVAPAKVINVTFTVTAPGLNVTPASLTFTAIQSGANPAGQSIIITNTGTAILSWSAVAVTTTGGAWLSLAGSTSGVIAVGGSANLSVSASVGGLVAGSYFGSVTISDTSGVAPAKVINVTFTVTAPSINLAPITLNFTAIQAGANPASQNITISNTGTAPLNWNAVAVTSTGGAWLTLAAPTSGTIAAGGTSSLTVNALVGTLIAGTYTGTVTISDTAGVAVDKVVSVTFTLTAPSINLAPTTLNFTAIQGGANPASQNITISNTGTASLNWSAVVATTSGGGWLTLTAPTSGTIAAGGTANLTVNAILGALVAGTYTGTVTIRDTNGVAPAKTVNVSFTVTVPEISLVPSTLNFTAIQAGANPAAQSVSIMNIGTAPLNWNTVVATTNGGSWLTLTAPTSGTLAPSGTTTLAVNASVGSLIAGTYTGTVTIRDINGVATAKVVNVTFTVTAPAITLAPTALNFTAIQGGANPASQSITISNTGTAPLNWSSAVVTATGGAWLVMTAPTNGTIAPGSSSTLTVNANVGSLVAGTYTGTVTIRDISGVATAKVVNVTFTVTAPAISLAPTALSFTSIQAGTSPASQSVTITNTGNAPLNWNAAAATTSGGGWLTLTAPISGLIAAGGSTTLAVNANVGALTAGTYNGTVTISDATGVAAAKVVTVTFTVTAPAISVSGPLSFTAVQARSDPAGQSITISNTGTAPLNWNAIAVTDSGGSWLSLGAPTSGTIAAGANTTLGVNARVGALIAGTYTGSIIISDTTGVAAAKLVSVTFTVTAPSISLSTSTLTFSAVQGGPAPASQTVTITNTGDAPLDWASVAVTASGGAWLTLTAPTSGTLAAGASATLTVNAVGGALLAGGYNGTITVSDTTNVAPPKMVFITFNVLPPPEIGLSVNSLYFNGVQGAPSPANHTVTITNTGGSILNWNATEVVGWASIVGATSGSLAPGVSATLTVAVNSSGLLADNSPFTGLIDITGYLAAPKAINIILSIYPPPVIHLSVNQLDFETAQNGANPQNQVVTITNTGGSPLNWSVAEAVTWMSVVGAANGTLSPGLSADITIAINNAGLTAANSPYTGSLSVSGIYAPNSPQIIDVGVTVYPPPILTQKPWMSNENGALTTDVASNYTVGYHFTPQRDGRIVQLGGYFYGTKMVMLWNRDTGALLASVPVTSHNSWSYADISPINVIAGQRYTVGAYIGGSGGSIRDKIAALPRVYGDIRIDGGAWASGFTRPQSFLTDTIFGQVDIAYYPASDAAPRIGTSDTSISFSGIEGGTNPMAKSVEIKNIGGGTLSWSATSDKPWLVIGNGAGSSTVAANSDFVASVDLAGLTAAGSPYTATITVKAPNSNNSPFSIPVTLEVAPSSTQRPWSTNQNGYLVTDLPFDFTMGYHFTPQVDGVIQQLGGYFRGTRTVSLWDRDTGVLLASASVASANGWAYASITPVAVTAGKRYTVAAYLAGVGGSYRDDVKLFPRGYGDIQIDGSTWAFGKVRPTNEFEDRMYGQVDITFVQNGGIVLNPATLTFNAVFGQSSPPGQAVGVTLAGAGSVSWSTTSNQPWLTATASGSTPGSITVSADTASLPMGTYYGAITVTAPGASNSAQIIPVTVNVFSSPEIEVDPSTLYIFSVAGVNPINQLISITNSGGGTLNWSAISGAPWVILNTTSGIAPSTMSVSIDSVSLSPGIYNSFIALNADGATPLSINVTLVVVPPINNSLPLLGVSSASMNFSATEGGALPANQLLTISHTGANPLTWSATTSVITPSGGSWLSVAPASGTTPTVLTVSINSLAGLLPGTYTGAITITAAGAGNAPLIVPVTLVITEVPQTPFIRLSPSSLSFGAIAGAANPPSQSLNVNNAGTGTLDWTASTSTSSGGSWLSVTPGSGTNAGTLSVSVAVGTLPAGTYNGTITISSTSAGNSPKTVPVTFTVMAPEIGVSGPLNFTAIKGGSNPANQSITITNTGSAPLDWSAVATTIPVGGAWMTLSAPTSGSLAVGASASLTVNVSVGSLPEGTYSGVVIINDTSGVALPKNVDVTFTVTAPAISLSSSALNFTAVQAGSNPASQAITITNTGTAPLSWNSVAATIPIGGSWLSLTAPTSGTIAAGAAASLKVNATVGTLVAGTYNGTISISDTTGVAAAKLVNVTFTVTAPGLSVSTSSLAFGAIQAGTNPASQSVTITNTGNAPLNWNSVAVTIPAGGGWLSLGAPSSGTIAAGGTASLTVNVSVGSLVAGTYNGTVTISDTSGVAPAQVVNVIFIITAPAITVSGPLNFSAVEGGADPASQLITITNSGTAPLSWSSVAVTNSGGSWLTLAAPSSGSIAAGASAVLTVKASVGTLVAGTYTGTVTISDTTFVAPSKTVAVTFNVAVPPPAIALSSSNLGFEAPVNGANPAGQVVVITNSGGGTLNWTAASNQSWLKISASSGTAPIGLTVSADIAGLAVGSYSGVVTISAAGASNTPQTINVALVVTPALETPLQSWVDNNFTTVTTFTPVTTMTYGEFFTPMVNGRVTHLAGYFGGTGMLSVRLRNAAGSVLAVYSIPATNSWNRVALATPVMVQANQQYRLEVVYPLGSSAILMFGYGDNPDTSLLAPQLSGNIRLDGYGVFTGDGAIPTPLTSNYMFGLLDISYMPDTAPPASRVDATSLSYYASQGQGNPASQTIKLENYGGGTLAWTASVVQGGAWLSLNTTSGNLAAGAIAPIAVSVNSAAMTVTGSPYTGRIEITAPGAAKQVINVTVNITNDQTPWLSKGFGDIYTNLEQPINAGYRFTPNRAGQIVRLGGNFNGAKTVRIYNRATQAVLATQTITSNNAWSWVTLSTPVNLTAGTEYVVAVDLAGSGGVLRSAGGANMYPVTYGNITINSSVVGSSGAAMPNTNATSVMYGQVDIGFQ